MYPTIVTILAETQRSMTDMCQISLPNASKLAIAGPAASEAHATTLGHPSFAALNITIDNEAESPPSRLVRSQDLQERGLGEGHS